MHSITEVGELAYSYWDEANNEVKMNRREIIEMIEGAGFEVVESDTGYNRLERAAA